MGEQGQDGELAPGEVILGREAVEVCGMVGSMLRVAPAAVVVEVVVHAG